MASPSTKLLRTARIWHKNVAAVLFAFFFIISITAVLLAFKDYFVGQVYNNDIKQKATKSLNDWLPLDSLKRLATAGLKAKVPALADAKLDRIDARLDKGYIRFSFTNGYNAQLNAKTGVLQSIEKKAPDWILKLHDGEIVDDVFKNKSGVSKTVYTTTMGLALFFLTLSGFWMWFKPKQIKNAKN